MGLTKIQISELAKLMQELPDINDTRTRSKQETVAALKGEILALQKKGYTREQIAGILTQHGLEITEANLKSSLQRSKANVRKQPRSVAQKEVNHAVDIRIDV